MQRSFLVTGIRKYLTRDRVPGAVWPARRDSKLKDGIYYTWPYGWEPCDFTPMMRRIFRGKRTRHVMMLDEMPALFLN